MMPHQQENLQKMQAIEKTHTHGFLCDAPGSGKSHVILELIRQSFWSPNVILCAHYFVAQWQHYCQKFPTISVQFIDSDDKIILHDLDLYVVAHTQWTKIGGKNFRRCIYDVPAALADKIITPPADFYWFLTCHPDAFGITDAAYIKSDFKPHFPVEIKTLADWQYKNKAENVRFADEFLLLLNSAIYGQESIADRVESLRHKQREWCARFNAEATGECFICCAPMINLSMYATCCHNFLCSDCFARVRTCPFCRREKFYAMHISLFDTCRRLIDDFPGKVLLVCEESVRETIYRYSTRLNSVPELFHRYSNYNVIWCPPDSDLEGIDLVHVELAIVFGAFSVIDACVRVGRTRPLTIIYT